MDRRWIVLGAGVLALAPLVVGVASLPTTRPPFTPKPSLITPPTPVGPVIASPALVPNMEGMQADHAIIIKGLKNRASFRAQQPALLAAARRLGQLGRQVRNDPAPALAIGLPQSRWADAMDAFLAESDAFAKLLDDPTATQAQAKRAYQSRVSAACTGCHTAFRPAP